MMRRFNCRAAALGAAFAFAGPAATQEPVEIPLLDRLEAGRWELRSTGGTSLGSLCLGNRLILTQPQHRSAACLREVIAADARSTIVRYSCEGIGFGRTTIRYETPRLVQIESQGVDRGTPFALRAEARRSGPCRPNGAPKGAS